MAAVEASAAAEAVVGFEDEAAAGAALDNKMLDHLSPSYPWVITAGPSKTTLCVK